MRLLSSVGRKRRTKLSLCEKFLLQKYLPIKCRNSHLLRQRRFCQVMVLYENSSLVANLRNIWGVNRKNCPKWANRKLGIVIQIEYHKRRVANVRHIDMAYTLHFKNSHCWVFHFFKKLFKINWFFMQILNHFFHLNAFVPLTVLMNPSSLYL